MGSKKKILLLDLFQHNPGLHNVFAGEQAVVSAYVTTFSPQTISPFAFYGNKERFKSIYGYTPLEFVDFEHENMKFDEAFVVFPLMDIVGTKTHQPSAEQFLVQARVLFDRVYSFLTRVVKDTSNIHWLENHDFYQDPTDYLHQQGVTFGKIFKREMRTDKEYSNTILPYPFVMVGLVDSLWQVLNNRKTNEGNSGIFWSGAEVDWADEKWDCRQDRKTVIDQFRLKKPATVNLVSPTGRADYNSFMKQLQHYRCHLHLNGLGNVCIRTFEGLSVGSIGIYQKMNTVWPEQTKNLSEFIDEFSFGNVEQAFELIDKLSNEEYYQEVANRQQKILDNEVTNKRLFSILMEGACK